MDFNLTEDQLAFRDEARAFAEKAMAPYAGQWDVDHTFPVEVMKEAGEMGFMGIYTPEALGGMGLSRLDTSVIVKELAWPAHPRLPSSPSTTWPPGWWPALPPMT